MKVRMNSAKEVKCFALAPGRRKVRMNSAKKVKCANSVTIASSRDTTGNDDSRGASPPRREDMLGDRSDVVCSCAKVGSVRANDTSGKL